MDQTFRETVYHGAINLYVINALLDRFRSSTTQTAYLFTLNQDTLIERIWGKKPEQPPLTTPGVQNYPIIDPLMMTISTGLVRPVLGGASPLQGNCNLIKLHGSYNWQTQDGSLTMVVGLGKEAQIAGSDLLAWYYKAFEAVLCSGGVRLMVIGYSFSDAHINEAIAKAAEDHGLRLYILDPSDPFATLGAKPHGSKILSLSAVNAVWRHSLGEPLPGYGVNATSVVLDRTVATFFQ